MKKNLTKSSKRRENRPNIDEYFLKMALIASERSTCKRHSVGAVLVKDKMVLSTGYNGSAKGAKDCLELGCLRDNLGIKSGEKHEICRAIHAEQNAIIQASFKGVSLVGSKMYCTHTPCNICAKMIANAGIEEIIVFEKYQDDSFINLFEELNIRIRFLPRPSLAIDFYE